MKKSNTLTTGILLSVLCFGAINAQAQNTNPNNDAGVVVIEEEDFVAEPVATNTNGNSWNDQANAADRARNNVNDTMRDRVNNVRNDIDARRSDLSDVRDDIRANTRPDNQPTVDKALKNQNPTYNN